MIEKILSFTQTDEKIIEKIVNTKDLHFNHVVLPQGDRLPEHYSNANVFLAIVRGTMSVAFNDQDIHTYKSGQIINVEKDIKMNVMNNDESALEFFIVKAPGPKQD